MSQLNNDIYTIPLEKYKKLNTYQILSNDSVKQYKFNELPYIIISSYYC